MITTTIGYVLAGVIAAAIVFIGARFIVAPRVAAAGYGVSADDTDAYLTVKGIRDIASGLIVVVLMAAGATQLLAWVLVAATIIPIADAAIVLRNGGTKAIAWGVHGATAAVMIVTAVLLIWADRNTSATLVQFTEDRRSPRNRLKVLASPGGPRRRTRLVLRINSPNVRAPTVCVGAFSFARRPHVNTYIIHEEAMHGQG